MAAKKVGPQVGQYVAIVTAAPIYHGRLVAVTPQYYSLEDAAWVVETGRIHKFVQDPAAVAEEAEFIGVVHVERSSVMGVYPTKAAKVETR